VITLKNKINFQKKLFIRSIFTGFFGGILFYLAMLFLLAFNFVDKQFFPEILLTKGFMKQLMNFLIIIILSSIHATIYHLIFKKILNLWFSVSYGIVLFLLLFSINLFVEKLKISINDSTSLITLLSLFIFYGVFISYSISFDYYETIQRTRINQSST